MRSLQSVSIDCTGQQSKLTSVISSDRGLHHLLHPRSHRHLLGRTEVVGTLRLMNDLEAELSHMDVGIGQDSIPTEIDESFNLLFLRIPNPTESAREEKVRIRDRERASTHCLTLEVIQMNPLENEEALFPRIVLLSLLHQPPRVIRLSNLLQQIATRHNTRLRGEHLTGHCVGNLGHHFRRRRRLRHGSGSREGSLTGRGRGED